MGLAHESSERPRHRAPRHVERVVKGDQWSARAPPRERARVSHSHQAHRQETAHVRRPRPDYTLDWDEPDTPLRDMCPESEKTLTWVIHGDLRIAGRK